MALQSDADPPAEPFPEPVRRPLRLLIAATALEAVSDSMARNLLPVLAVTLLGAGTAFVGVLGALGLGAFLLLGLPIGVLADRLGTPVRLMSAASGLRAVVAGVGFAAWAAGLLDGVAGLVLLALLAAVVGVADVGYTAGQGLLVPRIVPADGIRAAYGRVHAVAQAGGALAPALLAGVLALVVPPWAWLGIGVGYVLSVLVQRGLRPADAALAHVPPPVRESPAAHVRAGVRHLLAEPVLARITAANALANCSAAAANTLLPVVALTALGLSPALFVSLGVLGAGAGVLGAALAARLTARLGLRAVRLAAGTAGVLGVVAVLLAGVVADVLPGPPALWLGVQSVLAGGGVSVAMVAGADLPARLAPPERLGAVMGAQRTIVLGVMPLAALAVGAIGAWVGIGVAAWTWLLLAVGAVLPVLGLPADRPPRTLPPP